MQGENVNPNLFLILTLSLLTESCDQGNSSKEPIPNPSTKTEDGFQLSFNSKFAEQVDAIRHGAEDTIWIARSEKTSPDSPVSGRLENRNANGDILSGKQIELENKQITDFHLRDDGKLIAATFEQTSSEWKEYLLRVVLIDPKGKIIKEQKFEDYNFKHPEGYKCDFVPLEKGFLRASSVSLATYKNNTILLTYNCFYSRLTLLDDALNVVWSKDITSQLQDDLKAYGEIELLTSTTGTIIAASKISDADISLYNNKFGTKLSSQGQDDILVSTFDQDGNLLASTIIGTANYDFFEAATLQNDQLFIIAGTKVDRPTSAKDYQGDLLISSLALDDLSQIWQKTFDIQDEDAAFSASVVDGKYLAVGGTTGFLQVNTGSITKHGDAFLLLTDFSGKEIGKKIFGTPRHDNVKTIIDMGDNTIMVGGYKDGPITHDGDHDKTQLRSFGFIETINLNAFSR